MKAKVKHLFEAIAGFILAMLGFSGCKGIIFGVDEYGMPHAKYQIIGTVTEEETGNPIQGIKVRFNMYDSPRAEFTSDKDGKVNESFTEWPESQDIKLTFEDVDGPENGGSFLPDTLRAKDLKIEFVEDKKSTWYAGDYTISFDAKLKKDIVPDK